METDNVHPNNSGSAIVAKVIYDTLNSIAEGASEYQLAHTSGSWVIEHKMPQMPIVDGWYMYSPGTGTTATVQYALNDLYAQPIYIPQICVVIGMGCEVTSGGASSTWRIGIYAPDSTGGRPGSRVIDFGTFSTTSPSLTAGITDRWTLLHPGWYWLASVAQGGTAPFVRSFTSGGSPYQVMTPTQFNGVFGRVTVFHQTGISGSLPTSWGSSFVHQVQYPMLWLQLKSQVH
jgi:hypothetical protein